MRCFEFGPFYKQLPFVRLCKVCIRFLSWTKILFSNFLQYKLLIGGVDSYNAVYIVETVFYVRSKSLRLNCRHKLFWLEPILRTIMKIDTFFCLYFRSHSDHATIKSVQKAIIDRGVQQYFMTNCIETDCLCPDSQCRIESRASFVSSCYPNI